MNDFITEVNANPIPRDLFMELVPIAGDALGGKRRALPPDAERCLEDAPPGTLFATDCPENQMAFSIIGECNRRFPKDRAELMFRSFMFRWLAISKAQSTGLLDQFTRPGDTEHSMVHGAAFAAGADCPLTKDADFDPSYVNRIKEIIAADKGKAKDE